jgi:hypothetical protein
MEISAMIIFEKKSKRFALRILHLLPALLPVLLCALLYWGVSRISDASLEQECTTLTQALRNGTVHTYALTGRYPESLSELLERNAITYDSEKFLIEYVPNGANLFPSISVIPRNDSKGGGL